MRETDHALTPSVLQPEDEYNNCPTSADEIARYRKIIKEYVYMYRRLLVDLHLSVIV